MPCSRAFGGGGSHGVEHAGRHIAGHHLAHQRRGAVADVPAAAAKVQQARVAPRNQFRLDLIEIGALAMHFAAQVVLRAWLVLLGREGLGMAGHVGISHGLAPRLSGAHRHRVSWALIPV